jgi:hypothetical protein
VNDGEWSLDEGKMGSITNVVEETHLRSGRKVLRFASDHAIAWLNVANDQKRIG